MFSMMSSIFKTWTMLKSVQANLLVSQKSYKRALRWGYSDKRTFKSEENVLFVFKFLFRYFLYFVRNKLTCKFQTLTAYLHEESDLCSFSIAYQQVLRLLFCLWAILVTLYIFLLIHSNPIKVELSWNRVLYTFLKSITQKYRWLQVKISHPKYIFCNIPKLVFYFCIL